MLTDEPITVMGLSVRVEGWRYTEWRGFNTSEPKGERVDWETLRGSELYSHHGDDGLLPASFDDFENENAVEAFPAVVANLSVLLREMF